MWVLIALAVGFVFGGGGSGGGGDRVLSVVVRLTLFDVVGFSIRFLESCACASVWVMLRRRG